MILPEYPDLSAAKKAVRKLTAKLKQLKQRPDSPAVRYRLALLPRLIEDAEEQFEVLLDEALAVHFDRMGRFR